MFIYFVTNVSTFNEYIFEDIKLISIRKNSDEQSSYSPPARIPKKVMLRWLRLSMTGSSEIKNPVII